MPNNTEWNWKKIFANRKSNSLHGSVACDWWRPQPLHPLIASHWSRHRRSAPLRWILSSFARMKIINSCPLCNWAAVHLFSWTKLKIEDEGNLWLRLWNMDPLLLWSDDEQNNWSIKNTKTLLPGIEVSPPAPIITMELYWYNTMLTTLACWVHFHSNNISKFKHRCLVDLV